MRLNQTSPAGRTMHDVELGLDTDFIQKAHEEVLADALDSGAGEKFIRMSHRYIDGHWRKFTIKLKRFSKPLRGSTFVDYGCKFGHMVPMLVSAGVSKIFAIDVADDHLADGAKFFGQRFPVEYIQSRDCYVDIPSASADFLLANEVISHIHPTYLDTFYSEASRILRTGGEIVISDGNNWAHEQTRLDLLEWYELWERGTSKEFGTSNYETKRRKIIASHFKDLDDQAINYLAECTSGLWGQQIIDAVARYLAGTKFIERRYRAGTCPVQPSQGVVMERGFDPLQVIMALEFSGFDAVQLLQGKPLTDMARRGETKNFTIRGTKLPESVKLLQDRSRETFAGT